MAAVKTTRIWGDSVRQDVCRDSRCRRVVFFAQNVKTGRFMPFDVRPAPLAVERELETGREMHVVDLASNHFASCIAAAGFRKAR